MIPRPETNGGLIVALDDYLNPKTGKNQRAVEMLAAFAGEFPRQRILVVADSWFGNQGLWKPLRKELGTQAQLLFRLRVNRRDHRILRRQMEDRSRLQRTQTGYRQCRDPESKPDSGEKPSQPLHDGHLTHPGVCLPPRQNAFSAACGQRPQPFRLFRCPAIDCPRCVGQGFSMSLPTSA